MRKLLLLVFTLSFLSIHAQNELSFTINEERKLFANADNRVTVGGTEGILNIKKVICSDCDTIYTLGKNTFYARPKEQGRISIKFIIENATKKVDSLIYEFLVVPYPSPVLDFGSVQPNDTLKRLSNRIWIHQDISSPLTGIAYGISNISVQIGDTIFKSKNKVLPNECIRYLQLLKDTSLITIKAHYKGSFGEEGVAKSSFVAPPFLPQYMGPSNSHCDERVNEMDLYKFRYALQLGKKEYWINSIEMLNEMERDQIVAKMKEGFAIKGLEKSYGLKIIALE